MIIKKIKFVKVIVLFYRGSPVNVPVKKVYNLLRTTKIAALKSLVVADELGWLLIGIDGYSPYIDLFSMLDMNSGKN